MAKNKEASAQVAHSGSNGAAQSGESEFDQIKTRLHDLNRERGEIFKARDAVKSTKQRINDLNKELKEEKESLKEAEAHLQRVIDGQASGQKGLFKSESPKKEKSEAKDKPATEERTAPAQAKETPAPSEKPTTAAKPGGPWLDQKSVGELIPFGLSESKYDALIEAGIQHVWQFEKAITAPQDGSGPMPLVSVKGFGAKAIEKASDAYEKYRAANPVPAASGDATEERTAAPSESDVQRSPEDELAEAAEGVEFEEIDDASEVADLTDVDSDLPVEESDHEIGGEESQELPEGEGDDSQVTEAGEELPEKASKKSRGKPVSEAAAAPGIDVAELVDILANIRLYVPGEIVEGWSAAVRSQVKGWAIDVSDAADGDGEEIPGYPSQIDRWLKKDARENMVAWVKKKRAQG
jgi:hypothetical protein